MSRPGQSSLAARGRKRARGAHEPEDAQRCRRCGCTNLAITERCEEKGGCHWVENDLCSACLTPAEKKRSRKYGVACSNRNYFPEIIGTLKLQIRTLKDSFNEQFGDREGYPDTPEHASEIECLEEAIQMVKEANR